MCLFVALLAGLSGVEAHGEAAPVRILFDGGFALENGVAPVRNEGAGLTEGRSGQAASFSEGAVLAYPAAGGFDPNQGTLSLWVRPDWDSVNAFGDRYFWGITNPDGGARIVLGFLGGDGPGVVYFGGDGALEGLAAKVDWRAGEWHHLMVCWDEAGPCRALYVDGALRHRLHGAGGLPRQAEAFHVGSLPCVTRWMGVLDGHEADAAIDEVTLSPTVEAPGFDLVRQAAREDTKAIERNRVSREQAAPAFLSAWERLLVSPTLDGVAVEQREVAWEELTGMAAPMTKRVPIQARYAAEFVHVQPDLSIALGRANDAFGVGFACGDPFELPDMYAVTRSLHRGYQPIVESTWKTAPYEVHQTALTILPRDEETVTGLEPQVAVVRMRLRNTGGEARRVPLYVLLGRMHGTQNPNYGPFLASASRWLEPSLGVRVDGDTVFVGDRAALAYRTGSPVGVEAIEALETHTADPLFPEVLRNVAAFTFELQGGETATLDLAIAGAPGFFPAEDAALLREVTFDAALARAEAYWDKGLEPGMKLTTPEPRLNDVYRHLILSCLTNLRKNPERPWHEPFQSPMWEGVWPWECAHMVAPLCALGYHNELEPALRFFTERQSGIGRYAEPGRKPEGETVSAHGCYSGNFLLRWTNETGSILWAMAAKYRYSGDAAWLNENKASILAAWDWVQGERARTRHSTESGEKAGYYGLLPRGRVHDWEGWHHFFFSDVFTWKGMMEMAEAFRAAGLPEAGRLGEEASEYRDCLLEAIGRAQYVDPATGLLFVPNLVATREGEQGGLWWADGPSCMFATGLLDARTDARFDAMFGYLQQTWGTMIGLTNRMDEPKELGKRNPFWYVNSSERGYFENLLARGEIEKALLILYSNLAYGLTQDCFQTVERIHVSDANYAPFQPNASGNGRLLDMLRRMVIDDQEPGALWLLRGCPRRWFAAGQSIVVEDAPTFYGKMALRTEATDDTVVIDVEPPAGGAAVDLRVVVRHPGRTAPKSVTVNGAPGTMEQETVVLPQARGPYQIRCQY